MRGATGRPIEHWLVQGSEGGRGVSQQSVKLVLDQGGLPEHLVEQPDCVDLALP
jgi:hypothetical protein